MKVEMIPAYDRCASENGNYNLTMGFDSFNRANLLHAETTTGIGMWARMKNIMTGHIASPASPVLRTLQRLPLALQDELDELVTSASGKVGDEVDRIIRSLKDRCDELVHRRSNEERQQNEELAEEKREISVFLEEELNGWSLTIPTRT